MTEIQPEQGVPHQRPGVLDEEKVVQVEENAVQVEELQQAFAVLIGSLSISRVMSDGGISSLRGRGFWADISSDDDGEGMRVGSVPTKATIRWDVRDSPMDGRIWTSDGKKLSQGLPANISEDTANTLCTVLERHIKSYSRNWDAQSGNGGPRLQQRELSVFPMVGSLELGTGAEGIVQVRLAPVFGQNEVTWSYNPDKHAFTRRPGRSDMGEGEYVDVLPGDMLALLKICEGVAVSVSEAGDREGV